MKKKPQILSVLGGVFIATLVGLGIAMIVLAFEVYFHKKEQKNNVRDISGKDLGGQFNTNYGNDAGGNGNRYGKSLLQNFSTRCQLHAKETDFLAFSLAKWLFFHRT